MRIWQAYLSKSRNKSLYSPQAPSPWDYSALPRHLWKDGADDSVSNGQLHSKQKGYIMALKHRRKGNHVRQAAKRLEPSLFWP